MSTANNTNGGQFWKYVLIGGVPGILLGSGGTVVAENVVDEKEQVSEEKTEDISNDIHNLVFNKYYLTCQIDLNKKDN